MFRSLSEDDGGFVNEGFASDNGRVSGYSYDDAPSTKIEITRSKYDQKTLHDKMMYKKAPSKSSEFRVSCTPVDECVLKSKARGVLEIKGTPELAVAIEPRAYDLAHGVLSARDSTHKEQLSRHAISSSPLRSTSLIGDDSSASALFISSLVSFRIQFWCRSSGDARKSQSNPVFSPRFPSSRGSTHTSGTTSSAT